MARYIPYIVQQWSKKDNDWQSHSVNDSHDKAMHEAFFIESWHGRCRVIHDGRIIYESEDTK